MPLILTPEQAAALRGIPRKQAKKKQGRLACDMRCFTCGEVVRVPGDGPIPDMKEHPDHRRYECVFEKGTP